MRQEFCKKKKKKKMMMMMMMMKSCYMFTVFMYVHLHRGRKHSSVIRCYQVFRLILVQT
jgi:hypothetical protein